MKQRLSISIDSDLAEEVDRLAERMGSNRSATIERCIRAGLREGHETADILQSGLVQVIAKALAKGETPEVQRQLFDTIEHIRNQRRGKRGPKTAGGAA